MKKSSSILYGTLLMIVFVISAFSFYPEVIPAIFLAATFVVAAVSMMVGLRAGLIAYLTTTAVFFILPIEYILGWYETLMRFGGFTITAGALSLLSYKLRTYEASVASKERRLQIISDSLTDVLITIDSDSNITFANPATETVFGWKAEELVGKNITTLMPERLREKHLAGFTKYLRTGKKTISWKSLEVVGLRKDGTEFPIEISFGEFADESGKYFSAIMRDITIRKEFDKRMSQLAAIVESTEDGIIGKDVNGIITSWNKGAEKIFGYTEGEIVGKHITTLLPEEKIKEEDEIIAKILKGERISSYETIRKKKDGTLFPVSLSVSPIKDNFGKIVGASKIVRDISLRWEYEKSLKESDERYRSFIENSSEGIWRVELTEPISTLLPIDKQIEEVFEKAYFAECNQAMADMYGYDSPDDIVGKPMTFLLPKTEKTVAYLKAFMESGYNLENVESQEVGADGKDLFFMNSLVAIVEGDQIRRAWGVQMDITKKKRQEFELEKANERYKTFIENSEEAIWMIDYRPPIDLTVSKQEQINQFFANGYIAEANSTMAKLYGIEDINTVLEKPVGVVSPRSPQGEEFLSMFIDRGYNLADFETFADTPTGIRYGSMSFKGIIHDNKMLRGWVVQRETTKQKLQELEIKNSQERYKTFIENSDEGISRIEFTEPIPTNAALEKQLELFFEKGYLAEANAVTRRLIGLETPDDILHVPLKDIRVDKEGDKRFLRMFVQNGYSLSGFESSVEKDGKTIYQLSSMKGIIEEGKWVRAWMVRRDVTAQKESEMEKERLLKETEDAKRGLEVASAEKDRFLANLSHELRTPLVSILGYSSMLLETEPDSENAKKMITTINKNAKLQVQLIEDLLDLSRIISGKIELKKDFFDIEDFARDNVDTLRPQAASKGLHIVEKYDSCKFYGDKKRLSQVLLNLLSNAIKFTEEGEITICIRCSEDYLTIKVSDTSIGIDPSKFHLLFQPFKQLDSSSTRAKQGLGLGLSIVKNITELHGGKVDVQSKLGEGSEFKVYLPVTHAPDVVEGHEQIHVTPSVTFEGIRMLVVEDDPDSAGFIEYLYEQKGAQVDWVDSAKKAREKIAQTKYNLYIFDLSMPEEDGISLIKSVRNKGDKTKAVALTAFADTYYEQKAIEAGFDMFLKKPTALPDLLSVIKLIR